MPEITPTAARALGRSGLSAFPLALDGSVFGWAAGADATAEVLDAFVAAGGTLISTADHYATGRSEYMIGRWLADNACREQLVIATKIGRHPDAPGLSARSIPFAIEASLERLAVERIDLLSFDGEDPRVPIEESLRAVQPFVQDGRVGAIAAANYSGAGLAAAEDIALQHGLPRFAVTLNVYNLMERRGYEQGVAPDARRLGMDTLARLPLASGYLTGVYRDKNKRPASSLFEAALAYIGRRGSKVLDVLRSVALAHDTNEGSVAIAWLLARPGIAAAVVRAPDAESLAEVFAAATLILSPDELARLDKVSA
ncbi:aldo/keto reductase [Microbacteriaceae bacterium VKM Ac-2855]|nr:aldo/keto reductase [Microbacteriaceae bacterium VKM Ac-2855]